MSYEVLIGMGLGIVVTYTTALVKKYYPEGGARFIQMAVFVSCFVIAMVVNYVQKYAPPEFLSMLGVAFTTSITYYEIAMKDHD